MSGDSSVTPHQADVGALSGLPGLEAVERRLEEVIDVLRAEQQRRTAGSLVKRPAWKNLVFTGAHGSGKSRAAAAVGRIYKELGLLSYGHLDEVLSVDLVGVTRAETSALVDAAARQATGGVLMINDAHAWHSLPDCGQQVLWELYKKLTEYRKELRDELAVILAGQEEPLRKLLYSVPPLSARFRAVIDFPGYTPAQLTAILRALAAEAGLSLTQEAEYKAAALLAQADTSGNARLAVRLLSLAADAQARRLAGSPEAHPGAVCLILDADLPEHLDLDDPPPDKGWSGQYL